MIESFACWGKGCAVSQPTTDDFGAHATLWQDTLPLLFYLRELLVLLSTDVSRPIILTENLNLQP